MFPHNNQPLAELIHRSSCNCEPSHIEYAVRCTIKMADATWSNTLLVDGMDDEEIEIVLQTSSRSLFREEEEEEEEEEEDESVVMKIIKKIDIDGKEGMSDNHEDGLGELELDRRETEGLDGIHRSGSGRRRSSGGGSSSSSNSAHIQVVSTADIKTSQKKELLDERYLIWSSATRDHNHRETREDDGERDEWEPAKDEREGSDDYWREYSHSNHSVTTSITITFDHHDEIQEKSDNDHDLLQDQEISPPSVLVLTISESSDTPVGNGKHSSVDTKSSFETQDYLSFEESHSDSDNDVDLNNKIDEGDIKHHPHDHENNMNRSIAERIDELYQMGREKIRSEIKKYSNEKNASKTQIFITKSSQKASPSSSPSSSQQRTTINVSLPSSARINQLYIFGKEKIRLERKRKKERGNASYDACEALNKIGSTISPSRTSTTMILNLPLSARIHELYILGKEKVRADLKRYMRHKSAMKFTTI